MDEYQETQPKRKQTKDDALYGDSDYEGSGSKKRRKDLGKRTSDFTKPGGFCTFEEHTTGFGSKMFEKMGYKGGGLGKDSQGIVDPIEVKPRPKNMGIGLNDYKEAVRTAIPNIDENPLAVTSKPSEVQSKDKLWSKQSRKRKAYITAEELLAQKQERGHEVVEKIFDMRGAQVRVLTNLENLNAEEIDRENDVPIPEVQHNVRLMVDLAGLGIQKLDTKLRNERETVVALQEEKEKLQKQSYLLRQQLENMEDIMSVLEEIGEKNSSGLLTQESLARSFMDLQKRFADDFKLCSLSCIACSYALPLLIRIFQGWDPLENPIHGVEVVSLWKKILQGRDQFEFSVTASLYAQLLMEVVFPAVRMSCTNSWQARDPEPMLRFLESWEELLPTPILHTILDNVIMPKISAAVDSWDPRKETISIHSWIHPWLPLLGNKLENCYHSIRHKLASILHAWHPSDVSAYYILSPWRTVFDPASWERLIAQYIIPKLIDVMQALQIDPAHQNLEQFCWVRTWLTIIPPHHMLRLMDIFFNKWQEVLYHWLCSNPNFEEVTQWFLGWKELLPPDLQRDEHIHERLNIGLKMMTQAVEGMEVVQPGLKESISYLQESGKRMFEKQKKSAARLDDDTNGGLVLSLKEVIEVYAQENGLLLKPKPGRLGDERQIYGFGSVSIIIDSVDQHVFALTEEKWSLVSLEQLLDLHKSRLKHQQ